MNEMKTIDISSDEEQNTNELTASAVFTITSDEVRHVRKDRDRQQMIQVYFLFLIEVFKVAMASFLSLSVIQKCDEEVCSYTENFQRETVFGKTVIGINIFNIFNFIILYFFEFNREMFLIQYLDINKRKGDYYLPKVIDKYPSIFKKLKRYNNVYFICTRSLLLLTTINWILSGILVFKSYYSMKTITSYIANILLVITKLTDSYTVSKESSKNNYGLSAYIKESSSFNVIDKDYE